MSFKWHYYRLLTFLILYILIIIITFIIPIYFWHSIPILYLWLWLIGALLLYYVLKRGRWILVLYKATYYSEIKKFDEAFTLYEDTSKHIPEVKQVWNNWGAALLDAKQYVEAEKMLQKSFDIDESYPYTHYNLGKLKIKTGEEEEGISLIKKAFSKSSRLKKLSINDPDLKGYQL